MLSKKWHAFERVGELAENRPGVGEEAGLYEDVVLVTGELDGDAARL